MTRLRHIGVACYMLLAMVARDVQTAALPASEIHKIEALLAHVEQLSDAVFMRNNKAYTAKTAAQFLRRKWAAKADTIRTAQDFIAHVASVSSTSGQPYHIRFKDGREVPSGAYLGTVLKQLEQES
jgi:hypothetical protein